MLSSEAVPACRSVLQAARMVPVRAFDDASSDPNEQRFQQLLADSSQRQRLSSDAGTVLDEMGSMPPDVRAEMATYLSELARQPVAQSAGWTRGLEDPEVNVEARWYGVVISLNHQATTDLCSAMATTTAIISAITAAFPDWRGKAILAVIGACIGIMAGIIRLMDRGNGVNLTIPWTALTILGPKMIPTPR